MAGSGEFTRIGNTRGLNAVLMSGLTGGLWCPPGDNVATLSATISTGAQTTGTTATTTFSKAIPDGAQLAVVDATGALDTMEMVCVNGAIAAAATSFIFDSQTIKFAHVSGAFVFLMSYQPYLAILISSAPTDNTLGTEYSQTGYARQLIPWTLPTVADPPVAANQLSTTYGPLSGANGTDVVGYSGLHDSLTGGTIANRYAWWTFASTRTPNAGDSLNIAAAALTMQSYH